MASNVGLAFGTIAGVLGQRLQQKHQEEYEEKQNRIKLISGMVTSGLKDGSISNPNEAFQFLLKEAGGKGQKNEEVLKHLKTVVGATQMAAGSPQSGQTLGGQARPSFGDPNAPEASQGGLPNFQTPQQRNQQAEDATIRQAKRLDTEVTEPAKDRAAERTRTEEAAEEAANLKRDAAKGPKGVTAGSFAQAFLDSLAAFKDQNGRNPTPQEEIELRSKLLKSDVQDKSKTSTRSHLTGEALQAYDMNQMLAGIDPETGKKPEDPADAQRLIAAGNEMVKERQAKLNATTVRINMAGTKESDKKADAKEIAQGIINGDQPPDLSRLYGAASQVRAELERQHYPLQKAIVDWNATQRYVASLNGPGQLRFRQAIGAMDGYLDTIDDLAQQWKAGKFPALNRANLVAAKNGLQGEKAQQIATKLETQIADATADLAVIYKGGGAATSDALKLAAQNLQSNWTESVLRSNLALIRQNMKIRQSSLNPGAQGVNGLVGVGVPEPSASPSTIKTKNGTFTISPAK